MLKITKGENGIDQLPPRYVVHALIAIRILDGSGGGPSIDPEYSMVQIQARMVHQAILAQHIGISKIYHRSKLSCLFSVFVRGLMKMGRIGSIAQLGNAVV